MIKQTDQKRLLEYYEQLHNRPAQHQDKQPGARAPMVPKPDCGEELYEGSGKLQDKVAIITGGDSGIGRAAAIAFAREGADVVISYLDEHEDAEDTAEWVRKAGRRCLTIAGDIGDEALCEQIIAQTIDEFGKLDILVNNATEQQRVDRPEEIRREDVERTFRTNIFSFFDLTVKSLKYLQKGASIINSTSVVAYAGHRSLIVYSVTKGAIVTFTRSMSQALIERGIRVNAVAPGPIWTPLIPATFPAEEVENFGEQFPMQRAGQPVEMAPCYVFLASADSTYMTGQVLHPNGGVIVNG
jgi:NAD(P)-dependent dehydrogenase (short-subunit alcohol dehydrogenase family)